MLASKDPLEISRLVAVNPREPVLKLGRIDNLVVGIINVGSLVPNSFLTRTRLLLCWVLEFLLRLAGVTIRWPAATEEEEEEALAVVVCLFGEGFFAALLLLEAGSGSLHFNFPEFSQSERS